MFSAEFGFGPIVRLNYTHGVRIVFANGDVAHFRPSGNADELCIYSAADKQERSDEIVSQGVAEPDGLLRRLERIVLATGALPTRAFLLPFYVSSSVGLRQ